MCRSGQKNYAEKTPEKNKAHEAKIQHGILIIEGNELISNRLLWNFCTLKPGFLQIQWVLQITDSSFLEKMGQIREIWEITFLSFLQNSAERGIFH